MLASLEQGAEVDVVHAQLWLNKEYAETKLSRRAWVATAHSRPVPLRWRLYAVLGAEAPEIVGLANALGSWPSPSARTG